MQIVMVIKKSIEISIKMFIICTLWGISWYFLFIVESVTKIVSFITFLKLFPQMTITYIILTWLFGGKVVENVVIIITLDIRVGTSIKEIANSFEKSDTLKILLPGVSCLRIEVNKYRQ